MDQHIEDAFGLLAIVALLPIMLLVVLPATLLFDENIGVLRRRHFVAAANPQSPIPNPIEHLTRPAL